ncbi:RT0821/Lpp0805 family surface protein [Aestuariispira insulae]|uniref:17 kDa surface antigen n=1 Tax=Aestuariispira insulae TaxID=1461337 RepID=A0A3D9HSB2_9PROT|nr:RT0821/Lpp0805 family surface protein [Aestuariispira insulae]RED52403.1 surface antigen [Aestuariispira insulae]
MNASKTILPALAVALALSGCANRDTGTGEVVGTVGGVLLGGLVGSQFGGGSGRVVATVIGAGLGGYLGNQIGARLDEADRREAQTAMANSMEYNADGESGAWHNPNNGHNGTVSPTRTYYNAENKPCRDFTHVIEVDGKSEEVKGTACRNPGGEWVVE